MGFTNLFLFHSGIAPIIASLVLTVSLRSQEAMESVVSAAALGVGVPPSERVALSGAALRDRLERQQKQRLEMLDADNQHDDPHAELSAASRKAIFDDEDGANSIVILYILVLLLYLFSESYYLKLFMIEVIKDRKLNIKIYYLQHN